MPDPALQTPEREYAEVTERSTFPRTKAPIDDTMGYHEFVESEFPEGAGRCDRCGGGPDTSIHQKPVDHMERIANALEGLLNIARSLQTGMPRSARTKRIGGRRRQSTSAWGRKRE